MRLLSFLICAVFLSGCEELLNEIRDLEKEYYNFRFHENGVDQNLDHNVNIGRKWMDKVFYDEFPMDEIVKPNECSNFDKTYYVSTLGNDSNSGNVNSPFKKIQKAINSSDNNQCTLIIVLNGLYKEALKIQNKKNITILGNDRVSTKVESKKALNEWTEVSRSECGISNCKIIKMTIEGRFPNNFHLLYKDKVSIPMWTLARMQFREVVTENDLKNPEILREFDIIDDLPNLTISKELTELTPEGLEKFKRLVLKILETDTSAYRYMNSGVMDRNDFSWEGIGSAYYVHPSKDSNGNPISTIYFKNFDTDENPYEHISTHLGYSTTINDSQNIVIQNLNLSHGRYGIIISRNSHHVKVIGNLISSNFRSIYIVGQANRGIQYAPSNIEVFGNQITNNFDINTSPQHKSAYRNFNIVKNGLGDAHGVYLLNAGENIDFHHNFIFNSSNGIQVFNTNATDYQTIDLKVHHNLIINTLDDGLEPGGSCINCRWYANHLRNTSQAIRIKIRDSNSIGPVFIYDNVIYNQDKYNFDNELVRSNQTNIFYHTASNVPIYFYNNLFMGFRCFVKPTRDSHIGGPNLYFLNNIFSCKYSMPNARLGVWPKPTFDPAIQEYDEEDNPIPILGTKNEQPLFSHNWVGGLQDTRETIISSSGYLRKLYQTEMLHTFAYDGDEQLNYVYRSTEDENGVHIFGMFDQETSHILQRTNFCPEESTYSELLNSGLDLNNQEALSWQYIDEVSAYNTTLYHQIDRTIDDTLPNNYEGSFPIGPFKDHSSGCSDFKWLLSNY